MPKKKNYPKWFSPYGEPHHKPYKPPEKIEKEINVRNYNVGNYEPFKIPDEARNAQYLYIEANIERYDDNSVTGYDVKFYDKELIDNPQYIKLQKKYEEDLATYKEKHKEWKALKKQWDAEAEVENQKYKLQTYEKLKKELGK